MNARIQELKARIAAAQGQQVKASVPSTLPELAGLAAYKVEKFIDKLPERTERACAATKSYWERMQIARLEAKAKDLGC